MRTALLLLALGSGCYPAFPMGGAPKPRLKRAVLVPQTSSGCVESCKGRNYSYCTVVRLPGERGNGVVCFYD